MFSSIDVYCDLISHVWLLSWFIKILTPTELHYGPDQPCLVSLIKFFTPTELYYAKEVS